MSNSKKLFIGILLLFSFVEQENRIIMNRMKNKTKYKQTKMERLLTLDPSAIMTEKI